MTAAKDLQKGRYVRVNNEILQVIRKEIVAYGTHSHSKTKLFVKGLFSKGEKSFNLSHHENVEEVGITKKKASVISKGPDKIQIMDSHSYETLDADIEAELLQEINEGDEVVFINFEGFIKVLEKS
ncbi:MAG: hypothetical protein ABIC04_07485 [Nanoarchaeota archaeon]